MVFPETRVLLALYLNPYYDMISYASVNFDSIIYLGIKSSKVKSAKALSITMPGTVGDFKGHFAEFISYTNVVYSPEYE